MKERKYTFHVGRAKGAQRSYSKTEDQLTENEINLLAGNMINEFSKLPVKAKEKVLNHIFEFLMTKDVNDLQEEQTVTDSVSEPDSTVSDHNQAT